MSESMMFTIGTALRLACENHADVGILVEGQWLNGRVITTDGEGVVLETGHFEQAVVRLRCISAVRVLRALLDAPGDLVGVGYASTRA